MKMAHPVTAKRTKGTVVKTAHGFPQKRAPNLTSIRITIDTIRAMAPRIDPRLHDKIPYWRNLWLTEA